jgi:hypothetical protein
VTGFGKVWWLASYPKSGNTFLRLFLNAYKTGGTDINKTGPFSYDDMGKDLYEKIAGKPEEELSRHEIRAVRGAYLQNVLSSVGEKKRVFMKTHSACIEIDQWPMLPAMFTEAVFYIVRDPRDVCVSYAHHCGKSVEETAEFMANPTATINHGPRTHVLGPWSTHVTSYAKQEGLKVYRLRYEDMVERPEIAFRNVVEKLGWDFEPERFKFAIDAVKFENVQKQEQEGGYVERGKPDIPFFRRGQVGSWREELPPEVAAKIEEDHGQIMEGLGYGRDSHDSRTTRSDRNADEYGQNKFNHQV